MWRPDLDVDERHACPGGAPDREIVDVVENEPCARDRLGKPVDEHRERVGEVNQATVQAHGLLRRPVLVEVETGESHLAGLTQLVAEMRDPALARRVDDPEEVGEHPRLAIVTVEPLIAPVRPLVHTRGIHSRIAQRQRARAAQGCRKPANRRE